MESHDLENYRLEPTEKDPLTEEERIQRGPVIYIGDTCIERITGEPITPE